MKAWGGPRGEPKDFLVRDMAIEVKTSTSRKAEEIQISSIQQLEHGSGRLFLCSHSLETGMASATTLRELILQVEEGMDDWLSKRRLQDSIIALGWVGDALTSPPANTAWGLRSTKFFEVGEGFPRIRPDAVPPAIRKCSYSIMLSACLPFEVEASDVASYLKEAGHV
jgi:hypothetical protein